MSTFQSYSSNGTRVAGFRPLCVKPRGGTWQRIFDGSTETNTPAFWRGEVVIAQDFAYANQGQNARLRTTDGQTFNRKASRLFAGGGRWVSQYEQWMPNTPAGTTTVVLYDGLDRIIPGTVKTLDSLGKPTSYHGAGKHGVGLDGTLAYSPMFHSTTGGVIVEDAARQEITRLPNIPVTRCAVIDRNAVGVFAAGDPWHVWIWDGSTWTKYELAEQAYDAEIVRCGADICAIVGETYLNVHPVKNRRVGWEMGRPELCYNGIGWQDPVSGRSFVSWSENAGASVVWNAHGQVTYDSTREQELAGAPQAWPRRAAPAVTRLIWRGVNGWRADGSVVKQPGNFAWGQPLALETRPFMEAMPDAAAIPKSFVGAYISTEQIPPPYTTRAEWIEATCEFAQQQGCAVWVYSDDSTWLAAAESIAKACAAQGRSVVRVVQAYLSIGERPQLARDRVRRQVNSIKSRGFVGLMVRVDAPAGILAEDLHRFNHELEKLISETDEIVVKCVFGARRTGAVPSVMEYEAKCIANMRAGTLPDLAPEPPTPEPEPPPSKQWFPPVERFMSSSPITVKALRKQVEWNADHDGAGHRAIYGNARPDGGLNQSGEGRVKFGSAISNTPYDKVTNPRGPQDDPPDDESKVVIRPHGDGPEDPNDIHFAHGEQFQLSGMPGGEIQTRRKDAVDVAELWNDGTVGGRQEMLHANGETVRVLR